MEGQSVVEALQNPYVNFQSISARAEFSRLEKLRSPLNPR